jgi:hypothetical protein
MLRAVDESFFTNAPQRFTETWSIPQPAANVWAELVGEKPLHWCKGLNATWSSPRPLGVGSIRRAKVLGVLSVEERFFIWEEGHRYSFYIAEANLPVFSRVAEDYVVEPDGADRCHYTWTAAIEPSSLGKPAKALNGVLFKSFFADTKKYFGAL